MMAQFLRLCKPEICCVARSYGTQRCQHNYYETLNISHDASQKEIKQAFIKLSKQLHPDTSGKHSHADFVKLNEAYKVLGKENTRRQYDFDLKFNRYNPSYTYNSQNIYNKCKSQWEYEVRMAGGPWPPPPQPSPQQKAKLGRIIFLGFIVSWFLQMIFFLYSMRVRGVVNQRKTKIEYKYEQIRNSTHDKSDQFNIKDLHTVENLNDYLNK